MLINDLRPPQLDEVILRLQGGLGDSNELDHLVEKARDIEAHLERVATPIPNLSKGYRRSPSYPFGEQNAERAARAVPSARRLIAALRRDDSEAALEAALEIDGEFPA